MRDHHVPLTPRHRPALVVESPLEKKFTFVVNIVKVDRHQGRHNPALCWQPTLVKVDDNSFPWPGTPPPLMTKNKKCKDDSIN